jgi:hypothetical protein
VGRVELVEAGEKRIKQFELQTQVNGNFPWQTIASGNEIGPDFRVKLDTPSVGRRIRINITDSTGGASIETFRVFPPEAPEHDRSR